MLGNIVKAHACLQHSTPYIQDAQHITLHIANILKYRGGKSQTPTFQSLMLQPADLEPALSSERVISGSWPLILLWLWFTRTALGLWGERWRPAVAPGSHCHRHAIQPSGIIAKNDLYHFQGMESWGCFFTWKIRAGAPTFDSSSLIPSSVWLLTQATPSGC